MKDINNLINSIIAWQHYNFNQDETTGYRNLTGVTEELGELCHAHLKGDQGIRHTPEEIIAMKKDAIGDILIYLINYCDSQKISLLDCLETAWNEIKNRDWRTYPKNGRTE